MRSPFRIVYTVMMVLLISACVREHIPEQNGYKQKAVVWAILETDRLITVLTSGNKGLEDDDVVNMTGMNFYIYEDSVLISSLLSQSISSDTLSHHFGVKALTGHLYTFKASNQSVELNGRVVMFPSLPKPDNIELSKGDNAQLKYTLTDNDKYMDAYQFDVEIYERGVLTDTSDNSVLNNDTVIIKKYDKYDEPFLSYNLRRLSTVPISSYTFPVSDNLFNGKKKTFLFTLQNPVSDVFFISKRVVSGTPVSNKLTCTKRYVLIRCRKISPEYYNFFVTENKNSAIFGTPYFNPTNVYSNISGGLGLMAAMTERTDTVWVKK